jgi:SpoVK/Ycf46/Vps4 family AAA+-type ATPase
MEFNYDIKSIIDIITLSQKYEKTRKRARHSRAEFNRDFEQLRYCIEPLKKLDKLVGMEDIKKNIIDQILFYTQELNSNEMMHICITGPPGVGKTTVGKILAELFCSMGFLKTDNFKVVGRENLIGGYLGQTAIKTKKVLKEALNGVLMIDEVYSLGCGKDDSDSYSKECVDTINQFLSEHTENFVMIVAGYEEEVDRCFFSMNPGLRRRFPWRYNIKEYTPHDLKEIFSYQVYENDWKFVEEFNFMDLENIFSQKDYFKNNGGDCLTLFDKAKICHSRRVFGKRRKFKKYLNIHDIHQAFELLKKQQAPKKDPIPFGMYV